MGLRASDDTAALLSPDLYREFGVHYNSKLIDAFGTTGVLGVTSVPEAGQAGKLGERLWAMLGGV